MSHSSVEEKMENLWIRVHKELRRNTARLKHTLDQRTEEDLRNQVITFDVCVPYFAESCETFGSFRLWKIGKRKFFSVGKL